MRGEEARRNPAFFHSDDMGRVKQDSGMPAKNKARKTKPVTRERL